MRTARCATRRLARAVPSAWNWSRRWSPWWFGEGLWDGRGRDAGARALAQRLPAPARPPCEERAEAGAPVTVPTLAAFQAKLRETFPHIISRIEKVESTKECGWLIAGGAALRALLADSSSFTGSDVDIFIWTNGAADPQASATRLARRIWNELVTADPAQEEWYIVRSAHVITMRCTPIPMWERNLLGMEQPVQIILRLYDSPSEVLHGFDHDACCVGYDGEAVMALPCAPRAAPWLHHPQPAACMAYERATSSAAQYATRGFAVAAWAAVGAVRLDQDLRDPLREHVGINRLMHLHCLQPQALTASVYPPKALNSMNWSAKAKVLECQARRLFPNDVSVTSEGWNGGFASTIGELDRLGPRHVPILDQSRERQRSVPERSRLAPHRPGRRIGIRSC